jgi:hypothetical protein
MIKSKKCRSYRQWESDPDYPDNRSDNRGAGEYRKSCGKYHKKEKVIK